MLTGCLAARPEFGSAGWWGPRGRQRSRCKGCVESEDPELELRPYSVPVLPVLSLSHFLPPPLPSPTVTRTLNDSFLNEDCGGGKQWKERPNSRSWGNDNLGRIKVSSRNSSWCNLWFIHGVACSLVTLLPPFPPMCAGTSKVIYAFCPLSCTNLSLGVPQQLAGREFWL